MARKSAPSLEPGIPAVARARVPVFIQTVPWRKLKIDGGRLVSPGQVGELLVGKHHLESTAMDGSVVRWSIEVDERAENRFCWDISTGSSCKR